jgi:hypothetical protein
MVVKRLRDGRVAKATTGRKATDSYPYGYAGSGKVAPATPRRSRRSRPRWRGSSSCARVA